MDHQLFNEHFPDNSWFDANIHFFTSTSVGKKKKSQEDALDEVLLEIEETCEIDDPYSELSLFLSEQIKKHLNAYPSEKKWTPSLQDSLLQQILPGFHKQFPLYHLRILTVKRTWEKILYYKQQLENKPEAFIQTGSLDIDFLIREHLNQYTQCRYASTPMSYQYAQQIAGKISELVARLDGKKPDWEWLNRKIWSQQRHLMTEYRNIETSSLQKTNPLDDLINKTLLKITAQQPWITYEELAKKITETITALSELGRCDQLSYFSAAFLATKRYHLCLCLQTVSLEEKQALKNFLARYSALYQKTELIRRILSMYPILSLLPHDLTKQELFQAVEQCYAIYKKGAEPFTQTLYAFISAELLLLKNQQHCYSLEYAKQLIFTSYQDAITVAKMRCNNLSTLTILLWKLLCDTDHVFNQIPYSLGHQIDEKIGSILVDHPQLPFEQVITETIDFFHSIPDLSKEDQIQLLQERVYIAALQSDLILLDQSPDLHNPLLDAIQKKASRAIDNPDLFISQICDEHLKRFPELSIYSKQVHEKAWTCFKWVWYRILAVDSETSFDRYVAWHRMNIRKTTETQADTVETILRQLSKKQLPLLSF